MAKKYPDSPSFDHVAHSIIQLYGDLGMYVRNLEDLEKNIEQTLTMTDRPSVAFQLSDLLSLVRGVLIKVHSYKNCCQDLAEFGDDYDKELKTLDGMLSFIKVLSNFSFELNKRVDAIITEIGKPKMTFFSYPTDEEGSYCNCIPKPFSMSLTVTTWERLNNLTEKPCQLKLIIHNLSKNIEKILSTWQDQEHTELCKGINKIKGSCTQLRHKLVE